MSQSKVPWPQAEQAKTLRLGGLWQKQGLTHKAAKEETGQQISKLGGWGIHGIAAGPSEEARGA